MLIKGPVATPATGSTRLARPSKHNGDGNGTHMTAKTTRSGTVTGWLVTALLASGTVLADATPLVEPPIAFLVGSGVASPLAPQPLASRSAIEPRLYKSLIDYSPAGTYPLKPTNDVRSKEREAKAQPALPDVQVPATVQNLRRVDGR
jgi:hypothetical protein